eukprot:13666452-Alexandrium_andersonii.AAC.1
MQVAVSVSVTVTGLVIGDSRCVPSSWPLFIHLYDSFAMLPRSQKGMRFALPGKIIGHCMHGST